MRTRYAVPTLVAVTAGLTAAATLRRRAGDRRRAPVTAAVTPTVLPSVVPDPGPDAVVLPFTRPLVAAPEQPRSPARCGDSGGRTKAGAPCAVRSTAGGRCHHHPIAA